MEKNQTPKYHLYRSGTEWALALYGNPITPMTDEDSARRAARFVNVDISHGRIWDADRATWVRSYTF